MNCLPSELTKAGASELELRYWLHWKNKIEDQERRDLYETLGKLMGVLWDRKQVEEMDKEQSKDTNPNSMFIPLSVLVSTRPVYDIVRKAFGGNRNKIIGGGDYKPEKGEIIESMGSWTRDKMKSFLGKFDSVFSGADKKDG